MATIAVQPQSQMSHMKSSMHQSSASGSNCLANECVISSTNAYKPELADIPFNECVQQQQQAWYQPIVEDISPPECVRQSRPEQYLPLVEEISYPDFMQQQAVFQRDSSKIRSDRETGDDDVFY